MIEEEVGSGGVIEENKVTLGICREARGEPNTIS